ncbi:TolC family protein [bacterium]|nr:TolC family protein [bacterium]
MKKTILLLTLCLPLAAEPYKPQTQQVDVPKPVELPVVAVPESVPSSMGLKEAIETAFRYQSSLKASESQVRAAEGRVRQQASGLNPRLLLQSTYNEQLINSLGGGLGGVFSANGWTHNATLSQLLTDFGHTRDLTAAQEHAQQANQAAYNQAKSDVALQVKQSYFNLLSSQRLIKVQEDSIINRREHVAEARSRFNAGLGLASDVTRAETALSSALFQLSQAQTNAANNRLQFNLALGLDPRAHISLREEEEPQLNFATTEQLFELALAQRPELQQFKSQVASAQSTLDAAYTTSTPSISLNAAYQNRQNPSFQTLGINMAISFQALDGGLQDGRITEAQANLDRAKADLEGAQQRVLSQVGQAYLNLRNAEQQVQSANAEEANARETLRLTNGRYKVGLGTFLEVIDAQSALLTAQTNRVNALTQVYLSRAALTRAVSGAPAE